jgi:hypothetical protein
MNSCSSAGIVVGHPNEIGVGGTRRCNPESMVGRLRLTGQPDPAPPEQTGHATDRPFAAPCRRGPSSAPSFASQWGGPKQSRCSVGSVGKKSLERRPDPPASRNIFLMLLSNMKYVIEKKIKRSWLRDHETADADDVIFL